MRITRDLMKMFPEQPNVVCSCGVVLFSWKDIEAHYKRHRNEQDSADATQRLMADMINAKRL